MIPKKIHYCWFGGNPLPEMALKCIESWKRYLPDYEIIQWNESNFDVNIIPYTREAYKSKKFAFVSDYARFYILYKYGGLYFDTDVEVLRNMDNLIAQGPYMGCEHANKNNHLSVDFGVAPGLGMACEAYNTFIKDLIDYYNKLSFYKEDGSYNQITIVQHTTSMLMKYGLKNIQERQICAGFNIFPIDYFCPMDYQTGEIKLTENTYTIHHYMASWVTKGQKMYVLVKSIFGEQVAKLISRILKRLKIVR